MTNEYHLAYCTANDSRYFLADYLNLKRLKNYPSGVSIVELTIVISEVRPRTTGDERNVARLVSLFKSYPLITVRDIIWKSNVGRDFSSARDALTSIRRDSIGPAFVLVRNRSAYGPFCAGWYSAFVDQFQSSPGVGLVGVTINQSGHPAKPSPPPNVHVQTYAYLSTVEVLHGLIDDYPAHSISDRTALIVEGEIGLSRRLLNSGYKITSLYWRDHYFSLEKLTDDALPTKDIKKLVREMPFRYKFRSYFIAPIIIPWIVAAWFRAFFSPRQPKTDRNVHV